MRDALLQQLREALAARRWDYRRVAERTGLHLRTVRRLFGGQSFSLATAGRVARALGVDTGGPGTRQEATEGDNVRHSAPRLSPVVGWKAAAAALRVSRRTVERARAAARDTHRPWWVSPEALGEWWVMVLSGSNSDRQSSAIAWSASESRSGSERSAADRNADDPETR